MRLLLAALVSALLLVPAPASAYVVQERGGLQSGTNGIVLGPDGNLWATEEGAGNVVRMKPDGTVLGRFPVGIAPTSMTVGPGGRVWAAVTGSNKLVWIDALSAAPTVHDVSTAGVSSCGPVAVEAGPDKIYFSTPSDGSTSCSPANRIGSTSADGSGSGTTGVAAGRAYDLLVHAGKLYVPDFNANVVRRLRLGDLGEETSVSAAGNPDGITADGAGRIWITQFTAGTVAYFPSAQNGGSATSFAPAGGTLTLPFGIVTGSDGRIYVTGRDSANLARIDPDTRASVFYGVPGAKPWQIIVGPDEDLWFTDITGSRLLRFVNAKPRATTGGASALAATAASLAAKVDPRGNATTVVFDYGTTTAYGQTTEPQTLAQGAGEVDVRAGLQNLSPSTTYHVRVRATNAEGETAGADTTFTTPAGVVDADGDKVSPPADCDDRDPARYPGARDIPGDGIDQDCIGKDAPFPLLPAEVRFAWSFAGSSTLLTKLRVERLRGRETVRITCRGRGCPFKAKTFKKVKKGNRSYLGRFRGRRLGPRTRVQVRITKPRNEGRVATLTTRAGRNPKIIRRCLKPGAEKLKKC